MKKLTDLEKKVLKLIGLIQVSLDILDDLEDSNEYNGLLVRRLKKDHKNFRRELEKVIKNIYPIGNKIADEQMVEIHRATSILIEKGIVFPE